MRDAKEVANELLSVQWGASKPVSRYVAIIEAERTACWEEFRQQAVADISSCEHEAIDSSWGGCHHAKSLKRAILNLSILQPPKPKPSEKALAAAREWCNVPPTNASHTVLSLAAVIDKHYGGKP